MALSIGSAIVAFVFGAVVFFRSTHVEHRVRMICLMVFLIGGSFLLDNAPYLLDYCRHPDMYVESTGTMTERVHATHSFHRARLSYRVGDELKRASVPMAFYEDVPKEISIMQKIKPGNTTRVTRAQIIITARTLIFAAVGIWILLACVVKPTSKT